VWRNPFPQIKRSFAKAAGMLCCATLPWSQSPPGSFLTEYFVVCELISAGNTFLLVKTQVLVPQTLNRIENCSLLKSQKVMSVLLKEKFT